MAADYNQLINQTADAVRRIQAGDTSAWNDCYELTKSTVYYRLRVSNVPERDMEDLMQEIYIKVFQNISTQQDPQSAFKWIGTIAKNTVTDHYRKAVVKHETLVSAKEDEEADDFFDREDDFMVPERIMEDRDLQREVRTILNTLPKAQYDALAEFYFNERSIQEIAEIRGVPEGTIKSDLSRGRKAFKEKVLTLEKKYGKLFAFAPFLLLGFLFSEEAMAATIPPAIGSSVAGGLSAAGYLHSGAAGYTGGSGTSGSGEVGLSNTGMAEYSNSGISGASYETITPSNVGTSAGTVASAGISKHAVAGIIIIAVSAAVATGGVGIGLYLQHKQSQVVAEEASSIASDDSGTILETETELEDSEKPEEQEKTDMPLVASEEDNSVSEEADTAEDENFGTFNQELLSEPYPINAKGFSGFIDQGEYFTVETDIQEFLCLPRNRFDAMQLGETVDINGTVYTMVPDPDGYDVKLLKAPDGGLYVPDTEDFINMFGTSIEGYDIESLDILFKVGSDDYVGGTWVENPTIMTGYVLSIRKDAEILNYDPSKSAPVLAESVFQSGQTASGGYILIFDENGLVKQLMEIYES